MPKLKTVSSRKARRYDRIARWIIILGGVTIIASVIAILAMIVGVTIPLFAAATSEVVCESRLPAGVAYDDVLGLGIDADIRGGRVAALVWCKDGKLRVVDPRTGKIVEELRPTPPGKDRHVTLRRVEQLEAGTFSLLWSDGGMSLVEVGRAGKAKKGERAPTYAIETRANLPRNASIGREEFPAVQLLRRSDAGAVTRVALLPNRDISIQRQTRSENLAGEVEETSHESVLHAPDAGLIGTMTMDRDGNTLYAGLTDGRLLHWKLDEDGEAGSCEIVPSPAKQAGATSLTMLLGDVSLAVGDAKGGVATWFPVLDREAKQKKLRQIHPLKSHSSEIRQLVASGRNKTVASLDEKGTVHFDYPTSERHLLSVASNNGQPLRQIALGARGDALLALDASGSLHVWSIEDGCPEVSLKTLFGKVFFESYDEPEYAWQTTGGEDFEGKFSLVPLIFGTLKGTFYAMLFAAPLALFGAAYVSYFTTPAFRKTIKPMVEIMASVPSVVVGFLIALWLAPILQSWILAFFASLIAVPIAFVVFMLLWQLVRHFDWAKRIENGYEFIVLVPVLILGTWGGVWLSEILELRFFRANILPHSSGQHPSHVPPAAGFRYWLLASCLCLGVMLIAAVVFVTSWQFVRRLRGIGRLESSNRFIKPALFSLMVLLPTLVLGVLAALWLTAPVERWFFPSNFNGNFLQWLYRGPLGMGFDQRNSVIIAFGLGFTVIPIIFSIAEDSLSNVPYSMTAASMALGASRWQTMWRVVLPSASPGIFAAMMIGFGRAVGETMIVLMATGNTPILSWSPLNGMRTLSANIAVEIPEAPVGGTLYRVLFLCAVLLFVLTFTVNTAAELVRQRLRKRFGKF